jgi:hypothetical protein
MRAGESRNPTKTEIPAARFPPKHVRLEGMGSSRSALAPIACVALVASLSGCFGYNPSAKRWSYVGNSVLIAGGGAAIALDVTSTEEPCVGDNCPYVSPIHGAMVVGAVLVAAGVFGILFNATRTNVKTTR